MWDLDKVRVQRLLHTRVSVLCINLLFIVAQVHADDSPYKVGAILPLTGMVAGMGQANLNGITLFTEREPVKASKMKLIFEDSKYDGKETLSALNKLAKIDKVSLVMVWGNTPADVAEPVAAGYNLDTVFVSHDDHSSRSTATLDLGPNFSAGVELLADRAKKIGTNNFGSFVVDAGNIVQLVDTLDRKLDATLYREIVPLGLFQFQSQLIRGRSKKIQEYLLALLPEQALQFAKQSKGLHLQYSIIGVDVFAEEKFLREFTQYLPDTSILYGAVAPWFVDAYKKRFGDTSYILEAASGYVFAQVAAEMVEHKSMPGSLQDKVRKITLTTLAYRDAKLAGPGVRLLAPTELKAARDFLQ